MLSGEPVTVADPHSRSAAKLATLIALPVAIIAGLIVFFALRPSKPSSPTVTASPQATTPVSMPAPKLSDADAVVCRAFVAGLPSKVRELAQRPVTDGSEQNAAYGDPPITVAAAPRLPRST